MTCIIAIKKDNKVYMAGERQITSEKNYITKKSPKIIHQGKYHLGFAGHLGFQLDWEYHPYNLDSCASINEALYHISDIFDFKKITNAHLLICDKENIAGIKIFSRY